MRLMKTSITVLAVLLIASLANAARYEFVINDNYEGGDLSFSDTVTVDVFVQSGTSEDTTGTQLLAPALLFDDQELDYVPLPNCGVPPCDGTPSYILYAPAAGANPSTILYPQQDPWAFWTGVIAPPPGEDPNSEDERRWSQININWAEAGLAPATLGFPEAPGLQIAKFVFHVGSGGDGEAIINLNMAGNGAALRQDDTDLDRADPSIVSTPPSVVVSGPEPAIAGLSLAALTTLVVVRARRRNAA